MNDAHERLRALARRDGEGALGLAGRAFVHELRNCIHPMRLQLALLQRRVPAPSEGLREVLDGMRESIARAHHIVEHASRLADELSAPSSVAPNSEAPNSEASDNRRLYDQLCQSWRQPPQSDLSGGASGSASSKVVPTPSSDS